MLSDELTAANIAVKQAPNDADVPIFKTAIKQFNATNSTIIVGEDNADVLIFKKAIKQFNATNSTIIVGEDVDLLVLLTAKTPCDNMIYFMKPGKAQQKTEIYSSKSLSAYPQCQRYILFLHAITDCDTTSRI